MSLRDWQNSGWLVEHQTSVEEIRDLPGVADRDLADAETPGLSSDWRLNIAYNAALQVATALLAASGYRAARESHHYRVIQSLVYTIGCDTDLIVQLDQFRKKRHMGGYERAGMISDLEAAEMRTFADRLRRDAEAWLRADHPELLC